MNEGVLREVEVYADFLTMFEDGKLCIARKYLAEALLVNPRQINFSGGFQFINDNKGFYLNKH